MPTGSGDIQSDMTFPEPPPPIVRILLVDDDPIALVACESALTTVPGYVVKKEMNPLNARQIARDWQPDVIILDVKMPGVNGITLARQLKADGCDAALMFVTSDTDVDTHVNGLQFADQFLTKPYEPRVLLAQVHVLLRSRGYPPVTQDTPRHADDSLRPVFDPVADIFHVPRGKDAKLTPTERKLLLELLAGEGELVSKTKLLWDVWELEGDNSDTNVVEVYIRRLRHRIELDPAQPELIITVRGRGYYYNLRP